MRYLLAALVVALPVALVAQEKPVPKDSARVTIAGCAKNRTFIVARPPEGEPVSQEIETGRRFKLLGDKKLLAELEGHEREMLALTGLIRKEDLKGPSGIGIAGGRVRIGAGDPRVGIGGSIGSSTNYDEAVMDVEGWRPLPAACDLKK